MFVFWILSFYFHCTEENETDLLKAVVDLGFERRSEVNLVTIQGALQLLGRLNFFTWTISECFQTCDVCFTIRKGEGLYLIEKYKKKNLPETVTPKREVRNSYTTHKVTFSFFTWITFVVSINKITISSKQCKFATTCLVLNSYAFQRKDFLGCNLTVWYHLKGCLVKCSWYHLGGCTFCCLLTIRTHIVYGKDRKLKRYKNCYEIFPPRLQGKWQQCEN